MTDLLPEALAKLSPFPKGRGKAVGLGTRQIRHLGVRVGQDL